MITNPSLRKTAKDYPRSHEPIAWSLFGGGGMVVAFVTPVLVLVTGLLLPLGLADNAALAYERVLWFTQAWWGKAFLLVVIALPLYHAAHRIYHGFHDLHINAPAAPMLWACYGGATLLSGLAAGVLLLLGWGDSGF
ncbi:MAG: fumarate reductase subunit D [Gammaproteobacteria bacterium]|nr:MAG: fumarate reductase subunit D [Gammaproteobacteria bacterium]